MTGSENVFAFRASWASPTEYLYVSDGKIRRRSVAGLPMQTIEFTATMPVTASRIHASRARLHVDDAAQDARPGAAGDLARRHADRVCGGRRHLRDAGRRGAPVNLTKDAALDTDPSWSPDGGSLVYSSDKDSPLLQLWVRDMKSGQARKVTNITTQPQGASFSPDGKKIVFFNVDGMWRVAEMSILDLASGQVTKIHDSLPQPGTPTWSPDGKRIALAGIAPMTVRFREGTNQVQTIAATGGDVKWYAPIPMLSIDTRGGGGTGVVARRHQDGGDLRRRAVGVAGGADRRAAGAAAPRDLGERARAQLAGRFAPHPLPVTRSAAHRRHRNRRDQDGAVQHDVDAGDPEDARRRARRQASRHEVADACDRMST